MRVATQEPMLGALARQYPQGPDALYLLARQHTAAFQAFVIEQGLHHSEPGLVADLIWTRAMLVEPDQGLRVIQQSIDDLQLDAPDLLKAAGRPTPLHDATAQIYLDLLLADAALAPLLVPDALDWVAQREQWFQDALALEWQRRIEVAAGEGAWSGEALRPIWLVPGG